MVKVTFSLDDETVRLLRAAARRSGKAQSLVVREAVADYSARLGRLSEVERQRLLRTFDDAVSRIPARPLSVVDRELKAIRAARRLGGRRGQSR